MKYKALLAVAALAVSNMSNAVPISSDGSCSAAQLATINSLHATAAGLAQQALRLYLTYPQTHAFYFGPNSVNLETVLQFMKINEISREPTTNYGCYSADDSADDYSADCKHVPAYHITGGPGPDLTGLCPSFWDRAELWQLTLMVHEWGHGLRTYSGLTLVGLLDHLYDDGNEGNLRALALLAGGAWARRTTDNYAYFIVDPYHNVWRPW